MKDLVENLKQKLLEENIRGSYMTLDLAMIFWIQHPKHRLKKKKTRLNQNLKISTTNSSIKSMKRQSRVGENI